MSKILVTGASGLLGLNFCMQNYKDHQITAVVNRNSLNNAPFVVLHENLTHPGSISELIDKTRPDIILHCAAMANVDQCENQPQSARQINSDVPADLANLTKNRGIKLVHVSTDAVFDGQKGSYVESDTPNPLGVYARTKLDGEKSVLSENPEAIIARVNFYGWSLNGQRSLSEFFFNNLTNNQAVMGFTDVYFCPLLANDLAEILMKMVVRGLSGIYHTVSSECISKYEFGIKVAKRFELNTNLIKPTLVKNSGLQAVRSPNLTMITKKLAAALDETLPDQNQGINRLFRLFQQGYLDLIKKIS